MDGKPKIPCSAAILTLNCRDNLKRCLGTLQDFGELIVLDGNSTDGTPELAREFGAKVYPQVETEEKNVRIANFTAMRIKVLGLTTKDWILSIDSDEYISPESAEEIREFIEKNDCNSVPLIPRLAIIDGKIIKYSPTYPQYFPRVFNKHSGINYKKDKPVHEIVVMPEGVHLQKFKNATFAPWPPYGDCIKKDNFYLSLAEKGYKDDLGGSKTRAGLFIKFWRKAVINIAKAIKIFLKSLGIYLKHGYKDSLPIKYVWRFMRYHFILSYVSFRLPICGISKKIDLKL